MHSWHLITSEYPPDVGGVAEYARLVAGALAAEGDAVHVWYPGPSCVPVPGVETHPDLGAIGPRDLRRLDAGLDACAGPKRLLVQWVPHGFGYHSMNVWFCLWLARRARRGDCVELMVHEPYLALERGPARHVAIALVHRLMTTILLSAARRVWISIPAWEACLRPYALGRPLPMTWLPIPACLPEGTDAAVPPRTQFVDGSRVLVGHFGTYGPAVSALLDARVPLILDAPTRPSLLLLGAGGDAYRNHLLADRPDWADRLHAVGRVDASVLRPLVAACDVLVQPYPDGVSSRRTTVMAGLAEGRPVVTTRGRLSELVWEETGAVAMSDVDDLAGFGAHLARLLAGADERHALGARGLAVYHERFALRHVVHALRSAPRAA